MGMTPLYFLFIALLVDGRDSTHPSHKAVVRDHAANRHVADHADHADHGHHAAALHHAGHGGKSGKSGSGKAAPREKQAAPETAAARAMATGADGKVDPSPQSDVIGEANRGEEEQANDGEKELGDITGEGGEAAFQEADAAAEGEGEPGEGEGDAETLDDAPETLDDADDAVQPPDDAEKAVAAPALAGPSPAPGPELHYFEKERQFLGSLAAAVYDLDNEVELNNGEIRELSDRMETMDEDQIALAAQHKDYEKQMSEAAENAKEREATLKKVKDERAAKRAKMSQHRQQLIDAENGIAAVAEQHPDFQDDIKRNNVREMNERAKADSDATRSKIHGKLESKMKKADVGGGA